MIRIVFENIFFFLLPTLAYIVWVAFNEDEWPGLGSVITHAPLIRLFIAGAALMLVTLMLFSTSGHNNPRDVYVPASTVDGKLEPARSIHEPEKRNEAPERP
jgi:hypothetical protein